MKKRLMLFFSLLAVTVTGFSADFIFENQTMYPSKYSKAKIAIQWAASAKEVDEENKALMHKSKVNLDTLQTLPLSGKLKITIPEKVEYFRVIVWSKGEGDPDFSTNWIDVVPNKTYRLETDHLVPVVLMVGMGC